MPRSCSARQGPCSSSTAPGSCLPPTSTWPCGSPGWEPARTTRSVSALPSPPAPHGSATSASTSSSVRETASSDTDTPADVTALPWPDPAQWIDAWPRARWSGEGRPLHLAGTNLYLDRLWRDERQVAHDLAARAEEPAGELEDARLAAGLARLFGTSGRRPRPAAAGRRGRGRAPGVRRGRRARDRQDPHGGAGARAARRAGRGRRRSSAAHRAGGADRQGGGAPRGGGRERGPTTCPSTTPSGDGCTHSVPARSTACSGSIRGTAAGSVTTAPTGSPSTSSWWTRPPWCRSRSWRVWSRRCAPMPG